MKSSTAARPATATTVPQNAPKRSSAPTITAWRTPLVPQAVLQALASGAAKVVIGSPRDGPRRPRAWRERRRDEGLLGGVGVHRVVADARDAHQHAVGQAPGKAGSQLHLEALERPSTTRSPIVSQYGHRLGARAAHRRAGA
jgi:hypothetical protein